MQNSANHLSDDIIPGFANTKKNALRALYGIGASEFDNSPKGSVDKPIRALVDLINKHPRYATTSSCSGRITIFDPLGGANDDERPNPTKSNEESGSGKGGGKWLLSRHGYITHKNVLDVLNNHEGSHTLLFKHEPMLLHVACASIRDAALLHRIGVEKGMLRESGTVITEKRITVALRGYALALTIPLAANGPLRPSNEYLEILIDEANDRFRKNEQNLRKLYQGLEKELFGGKYQSILTGERKDDIQGICHSFPDINLWGHASVLIPRQHHVDDSVDVLVFGGFGSGPFPGKSVGRKSNVLSISKRHGEWDNSWLERKPILTKDKTLLDIISGSESILPQIQGHQACILPSIASNNDIVAIFGGRGSPLKASSNLYLYEHYSQSIYLPSISSKHPCPRWGHTFTALPGNDRNVAIVIGGRDESKVLSSVFVLSVSPSLSSSENKKVSFQWQELDFKLPIFCHLAVLQPSPGDTINQVIIFGGSKSFDLIDLPSAEQNYNTILISDSGERFDLLNRYCIPKFNYFAASSSLLCGANSAEPYFILSGGVERSPNPCSSLNPSPLRLFECCSENNIRSTPITFHLDNNVNTCLNKDLIVHHQTIFLSNRSSFEVLILGGGAYFISLRRLVCLHKI